MQFLVHIMQLVIPLSVLSLVALHIMGMVFLVFVQVAFANMHLLLLKELEQDTKMLFYRTEDPWILLLHSRPQTVAILLLLYQMLSRIPQFSRNRIMCNMSKVIIPTLEEMFSSSKCNKVTLDFCRTFLCRFFRKLKLFFKALVFRTFSMYLL